MTTRELQKRLITLGTDDTVMEFENNKNEKLDNSKLGKLLQLLAQMEEYTKMLRKKGISLEKFIGLRDKKSGNLPLYKVTYKGEISYLYSEEELEKFIKMKKEAEGRELEILEEDDTVAVEQEQAEAVIKL